ncbi:hypothetical protein [Microseira wollei]|uniref:hypothetical protein n=1 Tax=Microseira wollei TaxID=467598 RepID=UPI001CFCE383|nr:hypothetical protein [Microseira wollei]
MATLHHATKQDALWVSKASADRHLRSLVDKNKMRSPLYKKRDRSSIKSKMRSPRRL